jgi:membrane protein
MERTAGDAAPARILPPLPKGAPLPARMIRFVARVGHALWVHDAHDAAQSMAFNFFLSLVPLLVLVGFLLGNFVRRRGVDALLAPLLDAVPPGAMESLRVELERMAGASAASIAPLSIAGFLWLTSSGTHHMMDVLETAVQAPKRSWWKQRIFALAWVVAGLVMICGTAWALLEVDAQVRQYSSTAVDASPHPSSSAPSTVPTATRVSRDREPAATHRPPRRRLVRLHSPLENVLVLAVVGLLALSGLAAFYRFAIEHPPGIKRRAWQGAGVALSVWVAVSWAFGSYVTSLAQYALFYGSLAAVAVLLVWLYLTSLALLLGAEVNAQLEGVRDAR